MRAVMREFLFLLLAGQSEELLLGGGRSNGQATTLGYEDFSLLRPQFAASSWRVTAARLQTQRLVAKTWSGKVTKFQLTKLGQERVRTEFPLPPSQERGEGWILCLLAPQPDHTPQYSAARRLLGTYGYVSLVPSVYVRFWPDYSGQLASELQLLGILPSFLPINPKLAQPASLDTLLYQQLQVSAKKNRNLSRFGKDVQQLLLELERKNTLHAKDKQRIGTFVLSGLATVATIDPLQFLFEPPTDSVRSILQSLDALMRRYSR